MPAEFIHFKSDREGLVYLIHAQGTDRYKIGRCANLHARKKQLERQSPYPLKVIAVFRSLNAARDEFYWHKEYEKSRIHGEWFSFSNDYINSIKIFFWSVHDQNRVLDLAEQFARADGVVLTSRLVSSHRKYFEEASRALGIDPYECDSLNREWGL